MIFLGLIGAALFTELYSKEFSLYFISAASIVTFIAYASDKSKAQQNSWRTPESTLHFLALIGGWAGAAIAQQTLRHKSQKRDFRTVFWLTVIVNFGALTWLMSPIGAQVLSLFK